MAKGDDRNEVAAKLLVYLYARRDKIGQLGDPRFLFNSDELCKHLNTSPESLRDAAQHLSARDLVGLAEAKGLGGAPHVYLTKAGFQEAEQVKEEVRKESGGGPEVRIDPEKLGQAAGATGAFVWKFVQGVVKVISPM